MKQASLLKWKDGGFKNPLTRARGLGSAHDGLHHWIAQRVTAILAVPLTLWLCYAGAHLAHADYATATAWLAHPCNAIFMIAAIVAFFYHAALGAQVVIEDYVHCATFKTVKLIGMRTVLSVTAIACIFAVLKVAL